MTVSWILLGETLQYDGFRKVTRRTYHLPDSSKADYDIRLDSRVVAVMAITENQQVLLAKQYRPGPAEVLHELPGGGIDPGEDPFDAARRELLEETGFEGELHFVAETLPDAYSTMRQYNFVALNCRRVSPPQLDQCEFIEMMELSLNDFRALLRSGKLTDVATGYLGLDYLGYL